MDNAWMNWAYGEMKRLSKSPSSPGTEQERIWGHYRCEEEMELRGTKSQWHSSGERNLQGTTAKDGDGAGTNDLQGGASERREPEESRDEETTDGAGGSRRAAISPPPLVRLEQGRVKGALRISWLGRKNYFSVLYKMCFFFNNLTPWPNG